jgi:hypothetical protein
MIASAAEHRAIGVPSLGRDRNTLNAHEDTNQEVETLLILRDFVLWWLRAVKTADFTETRRLGSGVI